MSQESNAATRFVWCGKQEPHGRHEWLKGARRMDCPGIEASSGAQGRQLDFLLHRVIAHSSLCRTQTSGHRGPCNCRPATKTVTVEGRDAAHGR